MSSERWKQVEEIFQSALDLALDEREAFVAAACAADPTLRQEVAALIAQYEAAGDFIETPALPHAGLNLAGLAGSGATTQPLEDEIPLMVGRRIGAYRIVREIGRGGMGAVYLAVRADSEFQKRVAIKLVKRGMDTDFILRRFRNERQILASLDHPNIARLLDGGTTDDGLPYFVMEYIEGEPLYDYCDSRKLAIPERLRLFCQACAAVSYAHHNLIVHRDIKPGNILVTASGELKLLDFGIAKLLNPDLAADTFALTATAMRLMTPEYASPEQVQGKPASPASDIYSLGVLLYELLTGHRPYRLRYRAPHEITRVICEQEPEPPSAAIARPDDLLADSGADEAATLDVLCRNRGATTIEFLRRALAGNLDQIILKSLSKEPQRRYTSVENLCEDITSHLAGRNVAARRTSDFAADKIARPRAGEAKAGKSIAVLPFKLLNARTGTDTGDAYLGLGLTDALITRLSNVRRISVCPTSSVVRFGEHDFDPLEAGRALGVSYVLDGHIQRTRERVRVTVQLVSLQDQTPVWAQQFDEAFTDVLRIQDSISEQVAEMLVPQLTGDERRRLAKRGTDDADAFEAYIRGRYHWNTMTEDGFAKAITYYYRAIALDPEYAAAYAGIAEYYSWLSIYGVMPPAECLAAAREAAHRAVDLDETLAEAHTAFGLALITHETQWEMAEVSFRRALELNQSYAPAHIWYACQLAMEGRFEEALGAARRARELDPLNPLNSYILAWCLFQARRYDESIAEAQILVQREPQYGSARMVLSWALRMRRRSDEAIAEAEQAIASAGQTPMFRAALGSAYAAAGRGEEARRVLAELRKLAGNRYVTPYHLALIHLHLGERDAALGLLEESVAVGDPWIVWLGVEPQFDTLRADARFIELLRRTRNPSALAARRADAAEDATARYVAAVGAVTSSGQTALTKPSPAPTFGNKISDAFRELQLLRGRSAAVRLAVPIFATLGVVAVAFLFYFNSLSRPPANAASGALLRLTDNHASDWHPDFSSDGARIAFASNRDGSRTDIYVMKADGTDLRRLTRNSTDDDCPAWSPDGTKIAFQSRRDGNLEIYMMDADGSNQTNVSRSPSDDARPAWSPDGKFLVFAGTTPDEPLNYDIHVIRVDGSDRRRLTDDPGVDTDPAWSPDGSRIVFASDRDRKSYEIYAMTPDGGDLRNLTNHPGSDVKPVWSPDGRRIAFAANRPAKIDLPAIYVMNADGSQQKLLTGSNTFDDEPAWSPDSRRVAFQSERDGNYEIYVANARVDENESGRTAAGRAISLAVLPFTTVGAAGGDAQYLGVGLADLLTNKLGQLKQINCRTSGAVRRYLGSPQSPLQAGRELGVEYILTGAVERSSDQRVLTSLELTDVAAGRVLWAEKFNENAADIFSLQNAISDRIVRALSLQLTNDERERLTKRYTDNGEAHQLYLAGRYHWGKRTPDGLRLAISNFEQAIAKDARFALAYSGLADCHALLNWYMEPPPPDAFARAEQAALRAVELDDTLAEAHVSRAFVTFHYKRDWRAAEQRFRRAIAINPNYATAHHWYAFTLSAAGRHDEAIAEARRAQEIDPRSAVITTALANVFYHARRFDESVEQCMKALELDPGSIAAHVVLRWVYERQGRADAALAAYEKERAFAGETPTTRAKLAHVLAASGRRDEARKVLGELLAKRKQQWVTPYEIAVIHALLGDADQAFAWLDKAGKEHAVGFTFVGVDPHLDTLREDPRYLKLLQAAGIAS